MSEQMMITLIIIASVAIVAVAFALIYYAKTARSIIPW